MIRRTAFLSGMILASIFFGFVVSQSFAQANLAAFDEVDAYLNTRMKELGIPGAALVIVQGDQIVHLQAFGVADADGRPVTPQTPFFTGSTGKSFTALAIMQLVEAGQIKLDAPVQTYLPWFRVADANASEIITVRQLLTQVSGIPRSIGQEQLSNTDPSDFAIENNVRALAKIELVAPPGERYEYSNANYVALGMIIQAVTGQSYETYIREHIFEPLDMQNSFTSKTDAQQDGLAIGYQKWFGIPVASPNLPFTRGSLPAGDLKSRIPASVLRILLGQEIIPGREFRYMQIVYASVMMVPFLHLIAVLATFRRIRYWRTSAQHPTQIQVARFIALLLIWNAAVAYSLLVLLPAAFEANLAAVILFQPDVGWIAVISGIFAIVWGVISAGIGISMLRQTVKKTEIV